MKKVIITIVLALIAIAAIAWACTYSFSGLAWFPGFFVAICCGIKILELHENNDCQEKKKSTRC